MLEKINPDIPDNDLDILRQIITEDETWVFQYNPETKRQNRLQNHPNPRDACQNQKSKSC